MKADKPLVKAWIAGSACTLIAAVALAAGGGEARRQLDAHEHGVGSLDVVIEDTSLEMVLEGPMANFLGFEHAPRNSAEAMALQEALARLRDVRRLFRFPVGAACQVTGVVIDGPAHARDGAGSGDGDHDHDEAHDRDHDDGAHADITASYTFRCSNPQALSFVDVVVFAAFPETKRLVVQLIAPGRQGGATLTPDQTRVQIAAQ
ncbi:MAG: DUF2796 domain-containing protein [Gammaproteobacteria bacterium]|jgi:hypothetical protein|nr:DUF2796 domain-containing protein [Gammaproteobacteria bacterium]